MESKRLFFIESRDGLPAAIFFAKQTMKIYRTCVLRSSKRGFKAHHASIPEYRRNFIESYVCFKRYIARNAEKA